ncbi:GNAT family N-acetyltransferase [Viridibacillus sp. YIM B01967]|jgi:[ribosomal protein S5]-alanine N-acetyltransferase|uniref:GNAT family N-acetyltransferase n=1 Tax=Viridibacillus soli TaxID=2798301 RepID=A0ABS1H3C2_9BACL|nr:GNAT family protein [Viridibacillus soli]MBK3493903.1 GNAT family N-acetyltransferase [Viridibacillus soli]
MNDLNFKPLKNELDELISFMTKNYWEFHGNPKPTSEQITKNYHEGWYKDDKQTIWIENDGEKVGLIIIHDITDTIPLFDIRLGNNFRGKGLGTGALNWLKDYIFTLPDKKIRIEAYTRSDNLAMRKTLSKCGFVKEGYLRNAWENDDGSVSDSLCYATIRSDWENKVLTPIKINELPF